LGPATDKQYQAELKAITSLYNTAKAAGATTDELAPLVVEMNALKTTIDGLHNKAIVVSVDEKVLTHFINEGTPPSQFMHGLASGGVVRAATGLVAGILRPSNPGTLVLAGEPQTHGEVFMPLAGISQSRAMQLAQVAGDAYNFTVMPRQTQIASMMTQSGGSGLVYMQPIQVNLGGRQMAVVHAALIGPAQQYKARTGTTGLN
jgi:hypothetical protein